MSQEKKSAFVTGCASGIGASVVKKFAEMGVNILGMDLNSDAGESVIEEARKLGISAHFVRGDVSNETDVKRAIDKCVSEFGSLDMAANNAGIEGVLESITTTKLEDFDHVLAINLRGVFLCMKHELLEMQKTGTGAIVNTASVMGLVGAPMINQYVASKHGVVGLTKSVAAEFSTTNIRVNAICPGAVETPMVATILREQPEVLQPVLDSIPAKRMASTEEIAQTICWLCSGAPSYLTGAALPVDGSFSAV